MLTIREAQMAAFRNARQSEFEHRALDLLSQRHPDQSREELRKWVRSIIPEIIGWGFRLERDVWTILDILDRIQRANPEQKQNVRQLLTDQDLTPALRVAAAGQISERIA